MYVNLKIETQTDTNACTARIPVSRSAGGAAATPWYQYQKYQVDRGLNN